MEYTVYATVIRHYEEYIKADSKEEAKKIALSTYNDGAMNNYEDELVSIEVEGENDG
mgnify:CR=1 FL=1